MPPAKKNTGAADHSAKPESRNPQLPRRQRLENIGLLSTRVAHDLNNMLSPMQMAIPVLRDSISDPAARGLLETVEATVARATALVRQILEYSHGDGGQFQLILMQQLLQEIASFASDTFPRNIRVEEKIPSNLWRTNANLTQIHQVLLNLCVNAREAMPAGGLLRLSAENCVLSPAEAAEINGGRAGSFLVLLVEDTGPGFSPLVLSRLWEPFVTTKKGGGGTGLGLSTVHEIILNHGGFIKLRTATAKGSCFRIYLPAAGSAESTTETGGAKTDRPLVHSPF